MELSSFILHQYSLLFNLKYSLYIIHKQSPDSKKVMKPHYENEFEFKQNDRNFNVDERAREKPSSGIPSDRKILICANEELGINLEYNLSKIQKFYEEKLLKESITKAVIGTFERKKIINEGQFKIEKAFEDASNECKCYVDKIETWLGDSMAHSHCLMEFEQYKKRKLHERAAKINSIMNLIQKISTKIQDKKIEEIKNEFEESLQEKIIKIPENKQYNKSIYKMKFIKERVANNKRQLDSKLFAETD